MKKRHDVKASNWFQFSHSRIRRINVTVMIVIIAIICTAIFTKCKKEESAESADTSHDLRKGINTWLDKQKSTLLHSATGKDKNIELLRQNLLFDEAQLVKLDNRLTLAVIPVDEPLKVAKSLEGQSTVSLMVMVDATGKIVSGSVLYYIPGKDAARIPLRASIVESALRTEPTQLDGMLKFLSVTGHWKYQYEYKKGKFVSAGFVMTKGQLPKARPEANASTAEAQCWDWYLVTTYYYSDGSTTQTREYLGRTCNGGGCGGDPTTYQDICPDDSGGGGGDGGSTGDCSDITEEQAEATVNSAYVVSTSEYTTNTGSEFVEGGVTKKPWTTSWKYADLSGGFGSAKFYVGVQGVVFKDDLNNIWKFESISMGDMSIVSSTFPCVSISGSIPAKSAVIKADPTRVGATIQYICSVEISCGIGYKLRTLTGSGTATFAAE